jgi:hypothetical protein
MNPLIKMETQTEMETQTDKETQTDIEEMKISEQVDIIDYFFKKVKTAIKTNTLTNHQTCCIFTFITEFEKMIVNDDKTIDESVDDSVKESNEILSNYMIGWYINQHRIDYKNEITNGSVLLQQNKETCQLK